MLNNFELLSKNLHFRDEHDFYFIQVLQRKKDNPDNKKSVRVINTYYVYSLEAFENMMPDIIHMCETRKARAYLNPNVLNDVKVGFEVNSIIANMLKNGDFKNIRNAYNSACGSCKCAGGDKLWLIDLDGDSIALKDEIREYLKSVNPNIGEDKVKMEVPTRNGLHLLVKPHDPRGFQMKFPNIDVHKDNPTVLYVPDSVYS